MIMNFFLSIREKLFKNRKRPVGLKKPVCVVQAYEQCTECAENGANKGCKTQ